MVVTELMQFDHHPLLDEMLDQRKTLLDMTINRVWSVTERKIPLPQNTCKYLVEWLLTPLQPTVCLPVMV